MVKNKVTSSEPPNLKTGVGLLGGVEKGVEHRGGDLLPVGSMCKAECKKLQGECDNTWGEPMNTSRFYILEEEEEEEVEDGGAMQQKRLSNGGDAIALVSIPPPYWCKRA